MIHEFGAARSVYPVYVAAMMVVDVFCNAPAMGRRLKLPPWLLFAFIAVAIAVFVIAVQHLFQRNRKAVPLAWEPGSGAVSDSAAMAVWERMAGASSMVDGR